MSSPMERRSPVLRLLDAFLQEENIKWVLGLGVCILLGSSLRLVTLHWAEYTPVWKYLILVGYTVAIFTLGEFGYQRLRLRKTGTVLMSLTVLLIPISFLALHWVRPPEEATVLDQLRHSGFAVLLGLNLAWSAVASWRIFGHFLRRPQPTFFVSYLILCVAGAVFPGLPKSWGLGLTLFLWGVFSIGTVKVNRHVFWLTEDRRLPRIFGFFPILLLGAQFAAVFLLAVAGHVTPAWMGLLSVLVSLPILMTADAVAHVFERRTGGLVRPIPWSISGPLALGTMLSAAGVVLALTGWPGSPAIVPTAIIAAVAMGVVAHRTKQGAFVWGMVFCLIIAYQTSPVFFKELVLQIRDQAAAAVRESRLPYAFYGLTYAPLIIVFSVIAALLQRRGNKLFAGPFQKLATVLPCVLLGVSWTHPSAVLPVALVLSPLFVAQAALFRQTIYLVAANVAYLAAAYGTPGFARHVLGVEFSSESALLIWPAAAGLLLLPGALCDRWACTWMRSATDSPPPNVNNICQRFSLASAIAAAVAWCVQFGLPLQSTFGAGMSAGFVIALLLAIHALRWLKTGLGELTLTFTAYVGFLWLVAGEWDVVANKDLLCWILLGMWGLSHILEQVATTRFARAFGPAAFRVSTGGLSVLFGVFVVTWFAQHAGSAGSSGISGLLLLLWGLDASRRMKSYQVATIAWSAVFVYVTGTLSVWLGPTVASTWWMAAWAMTGFVLLGVRRVYGPVRSVTSANIFPETSRTDAASPREDDCRAPDFVVTEPASKTSEGSCQSLRSDAWLLSLDVVLPLLFLAISLFSLASLGWPQRFAAVVALGGLMAIRKWGLPNNPAEVVLPLSTWQLLAACVAGLSGMTCLIPEITLADLPLFGLPVAALGAICLWAFESRRLRQWTSNPELLAVHQGLLLGLAIALLIGAAQGITRFWTNSDLVWAASAWLAIAGTAITRAIRTQNQHWVWCAEGVLLASVAYFRIAGALSLLNPGAEFVLLCSGLSLWCTGRWTRARPSLAILSKPFQQTGFLLPLTVLPVALYREFANPNAVWAGANSLPLLGAAAFYFWRGIERRQLGTTTLSAVLLNVACLLLWNDLQWTDPQLFLIPLGCSILLVNELMDREIPPAYRDRLRFVGSLVILVSPTFHIVTGSWLHILTLMIAASLLALTAIGLRVRTLLYTSSAFLLADLVALVARGSIDEPNVLWIAGVVLGASIIALGAVCENHRETVLARLRYLAAELEQWA